MAKKIKLKDVLKEAITAGPTSAAIWGEEMVRSLNSLKSDIDDQKHDKLIKYADRWPEKALELSELAEQMKEIIIRMRTR